MLPVSTCSASIRWQLSRCRRGWSSSRSHRADGQGRSSSLPRSRFSAVVSRHQSQVLVHRPDTGPACLQGAAQLHRPAVEPDRARIGRSFIRVDLPAPLSWPGHGPASGADAHGGPVRPQVPAPVLHVYVSRGCPLCAAAEVYLRQQQRMRPPRELRLHRLEADPQVLAELQEISGVPAFRRPGCPPS